MNNEHNIEINGSVNGIINLGNHSININAKGKNFQSNSTSENTQLDDKNTVETKSSNPVIKVIIEIIVGVIISVIGGYILFKFNMN